MLQKPHLKTFAFALLIFCFLFLTFAPAANAAGIIATPTGLCPGGVACENGVCKSSTLPCNFTLDNILQTGVNVAKLIFGITGSLMLLFILYGGFQMVTSFGNAEGIQAGKKTLTAAFVGLIIIFGAALLVRFVAGLILPNMGRPGTEPGAVIPIEEKGAMPGIEFPNPN